MLEMEGGLWLTTPTFPPTLNSAIFMTQTPKLIMKLETPHSSKWQEYYFQS